MIQKFTAYIHKLGAGNFDLAIETGNADDDIRMDRTNETSLKRRETLFLHFLHKLIPHVNDHGSLLFNLIIIILFY